MLKINIIIEEDYILDILNKRWLLKQYKKSKENILNWIYSWNKIWYREPKNEWIIYFRINKQFRAFWRFKDWTLIVFDINNHQN